MTLAELSSRPNTDDLFSLANAICAGVDAPVTIEDRHSRVLAFSGRQDEADALRIATVLGLQVPEDHIADVERRSVMRQVATSRRACFFDAVALGGGDATLGRTAVAVRAGDLLLGYVWAAVPAPLSPALEQWLLEAADIVAVHLQQLATETDREHQRLADLLVAVLHGGPEARAAGTRLGLSAGPNVVVALEVRQGEPGAAQDRPRTLADTERLRTALGVHLTVTSRGTVTADLGGTVFAIVPVRDADGADLVLRTCRDFLARADRSAVAAIGLSELATDVADLPRARAEAERALRVVRSGRSGRADRVERCSDVEVDAMLIAMRQQCEENDIGPTGGYARIAAYDAEKNANLLGTVRAWLDTHGDTVAAAEALHVHPNTFRYRLRRAHEVGEVDLADPQERFALTLQLRLFGDRPWCARTSTPQRFGPRQR